MTFFLPQDHIQEVLNKWESIDDEIWAKIIVLGKSYTNTPIGLLSLQYLWFLPSKQPVETNIIFKIVVFSYLLSKYFHNEIIKQS